MADATDPSLLDELLGFRAQFSDRECDGSPLRIRAEGGESEQTEANLRAVLWDAAQRLKAQDAALAAVTADRDRAVRERDEARRAFHDAVVRSAGVVPQSGQAIYDPAQADRAERERPPYGYRDDKQERLFTAALAARTGGRADGE